MAGDDEQQRLADQQSTRRDAGRLPRSVKHSRAWLLLFIAPILLGLFRLRFDTDVLNLLPNDLPAVEGLKLYHKHFANNREVIITVTAKNSADAEIAARNVAISLQAATNLVAEAVWQPAWMDRPEEMAEF